MKKRSFIRVFALLLCAMMLFTACSEKSSGGGGGSSKKSSTSNTYETPIKLMMETRNTKKITDITTLYVNQLNGFAESEVKAVLKAMSKSDQMNETLDNLADQNQDNIDNWKSEYGDDYKYTYEIKDKTKLETEDLDNAKEDIHARGEQLLSIVESTKEYDSDSWKDVADNLDMSVSEAKAYISALEDLGKEFAEAKVEDGYDLEVTITLSGSELDEDEVSETETHVYKVNGKWIASNAIASIYYICLGMGSYA